MRPFFAFVAAGTSIAAFVPFLQRRASADDAARPSLSTSVQAAAPSGAPAGAVSVLLAPKKPPPFPPLAGIDLDKIALHDDEATAPGLLGRTAHLSLDVGLQRVAQRILRDYAFPEAAVVMLDTANGRVLVWASHVEKGTKRDICVEANAPAASVFKIVTGAALVESAGLSPETRQCYSGGESRVTAQDLIDDPKRDRWCATLGEAMGRSLNTVFARLAQKHLNSDTLTNTATAFGFGEAIPFDVPAPVSAVHIPEDKLGFARTAAGFWNSTMSPLEAVNIASTVANRGETLRPVIVESVVEGAQTLYQAPKRLVLRRAVHADTALALTSMMENTTSGGTSYRAFHDPEGRAFLPNISVAGKTGTLTRAETEQFYTWFVGFAPSRTPEVAIAVLVVNSPVWRAKANIVARDVLRAYFASKGAPGVSKP